ncbi:MAG: hypothetical protein RL748_1643 [Pseudomonadota bacterium]
MITLDWNKGSPATPGVYFLALTLGRHLGEYGIARWDNSLWEHAEPETILGWLPIEAMVAALPPDLKLKWKDANPLAPDWGFLLTESGIVFADWDGSGWNPTPQASILGSVSLGELLAKCQFNWPGTLEPLPESTTIDESSLTAWEEIPE